MASVDALPELFSKLFQAHPWHGVPAGDPEGMLTVYVEIVPTDPVKYELDKPSGHLRIDRPQRFSSLPPTLYGFIPQTYCGTQTALRCEQRTQLRGIKGDGDPLDVCVLTEKTIGAGAFLARARPIGGLRLVDADQADDKIIAVLEGDLAYGHLTELAQCPKPLVDRLSHYFSSYKQLPTETLRKVQIAEIYDRAEAIEVVRSSIADYRTDFGAPEARLDALRALLRATP